MNLTWLVKSQLLHSQLLMPKLLRAPLKIVFIRDCGVSSVLESSCMLYTLRFSVRCFLALTKKSEFLEVPLSEVETLRLF